MGLTVGCSEGKSEELLMTSGSKLVLMTGYDDLVFGIEETCGKKSRLCAFPEIL